MSFWRGSWSEPWWRPGSSVVATPSSRWRGSSTWGKGLNEGERRRLWLRPMEESTWGRQGVPLRIWRRISKKNSSQFISARHSCTDLGAYTSVAVACSISAIDLLDPRAHSLRCGRALTEKDKWKKEKTRTFLDFCIINFNFCLLSKKRILLFFCLQTKRGIYFE